MAIDTNISYFKEDVGKNLYRKKTYYTLVVEQEVIANSKDEADNKFTECGLDHSKINYEITETKDGVETLEGVVVERQTMPKMRKVIAEHMLRSNGRIC